MRHLLLFAALSACHPVTGSRILARDLAGADAQYAALPSTLIAGFSAEPGAPRVFTAAQLRRLAAANGLKIENPADLCFEIPMSRLKEDDALSAMRRVLPPEATLKILEIQSAAVPAGNLEFPLSGLQSAGLWRGEVKYADTKTFPVWARVSLSVNYSAVVAAADLPADIAIPEGALRLEQRTGSLQHEITAATIAEVVGRAPKHLLRAGALIPIALLTEPPAVHRGDSVRVEVRSGPARLHFDAIAEAPAFKGAIVALRNPANGKTFKARLDSPNTAILQLGGVPSL